MHELHLHNAQRVTRRRLFGSAGLGIGSAALAALLQRDTLGGGDPAARGACPVCPACRTTRPRPSGS